jgi:hypothetical protein
MNQHRPPAHSARYSRSTVAGSYHTRIRRMVRPISVESKRIMVTAFAPMATAFYTSSGYETEMCECLIVPGHVPDQAPT